MDSRLFPYQKLGVGFIEAAGGRAILADDMGLGKTIEALCWAAEQNDIRRVLIIAPANVTYKWKNEVANWTDWRSGIIVGYTARRPPTPVQICSYNVMAARYKELMGEEWDLIIFDEVHALKGNPKKTKRVAAAKKLKSKYMLALSGTPFLSRPIELFNTLDMVEPGRWNFWSFFNRYCGGMDDVNGPGRGATNIQGLKNMLRDVMIRRLKTEVRDQLPPLTRTLLPVDINTEEYRAALKTLNKKNALTVVNNLYHLIGREKAKIAVEWAHDFFAQSEPNVKLVLAAYHLDVIQYLVKELRQYGATSITGDVSQSDRDIRVRAFQSGPRPRVLVINMAGGEGIDLFGIGDVDSSTILFIERQWTPAREAQLEGRLDRVGQRSPVQSYYLSAVGTYDIDIAELVSSKWKTMKDVLDMEDIKTTVVERILQ